LKHERQVTILAAMMATGASFVVFALTLALTAVLSEKSISPMWELLITVYMIVGGIIATGSIYLLLRINTSVLKEIENIRKKYACW
jgi:uncharacterized membrane protein YgaE (UPF0421/DUF939 family)